MEQELATDKQEEVVTEGVTQEESQEEVQQQVEQTDETEPENVPAWAKKRFSKLTKKRYEERSARERAEKEAEYWRNMAQGNKPEEKPTSKPTKEQFDYDDDKYVEALAEWKADETIRKREQDVAAKNKEADQYRIIQETAKRKDSIVADGLEKFTDFDDVVLSEPGEIINEEVVGSLIESDMPAEIAYHLCKNPEQGKRIAAMSPVKRAIEFGKIEARLSSSQKKKGSSAPPPIKPVSGSSGGVSDWINDDDLSPEAWAAKRNKQLYGGG